MKERIVTVLACICVTFIWVAFTIAKNSPNATSTTDYDTNTSTTIKQNYSTNTNYSSNNYKKCQYKNSNGTRTCTSNATHGDLCEYHFNYLNDIYNSYVK